MYNFDHVIERRNTNSLKYDFVEEYGLPEDIIPMWVADMDFPTAPSVINALEEKARHGIFGYSNIKDDYFLALSNWYQTHFSFSLEKEWLITTPGIVFAISMAVRAFTSPGESIIIQTPVYYPFFHAIQKNGRKLVTSSLVLEDGIYRMDFEDFEQKVISRQVKMFILCSPHNPVGRVWTKEELEKIAGICLKHHVIIVSDEIHSDFVREGHRHIVTQTLSEEISMQTITCTSPSKTFNLAGLQISNIFIKNEAYRRKMKSEIEKTGYDEPGIMAVTACQAAYEKGEKWLDSLKIYLESNLQKTDAFLRKRIPSIRLIKPEGTYLIWLDCRRIPLPAKEINTLFTHKAKIWTDSGIIFGKEGIGFERINIACPWIILDTALKNLELAVNSI